MYYLEVVRVLFHHPLEILVTVVLKKQLPRLHTVVLVLFRGDTEEVYGGAHYDWYSHLLSELYNRLRLVTGGSMNEEKHIYCSVFCARLVLVLETWLGLRNIFNIY